MASSHGVRVAGAEVSEPGSAQDGNRPGEEPHEGPVLRSTRLPAGSASTLDSSQDDQEASAAELRDALDALQASLEGRPVATASAAPGPAQRRRLPSARAVRLPGAAVLALAGIALAAVAAGTARWGS